MTPTQYAQGMQWLTRLSAEAEQMGMKNLARKLMECHNEMVRFNFIDRKIADNWYPFED